MVREIMRAEELDAVIKSAGHRAVLIDFYATWCGPCKAIAPTLEALSHKYSSIIVVKVNVDRCESLCAKYRVSSMPTFKIILNGAQVATFSGADTAKLEALMKKYHH